MGSDLDDLDDAEALTTTTRMQDAQPDEEADFDSLLLKPGSNPVADLLQLTRLERLLWSTGWRPDHESITRRLFAALDYSRTGFIPISAFDFTLKHFQAVFNVSKPAFDFVAVSRACLHCTLPAPLAYALQCAAPSARPSPGSFSSRCSKASKHVTRRSVLARLMKPRLQELKSSHAKGAAALVTFQDFCGFMAQVCAAAAKTLLHGTAGSKCQRWRMSSGMFDRHSNLTSRLDRAVRA